MDVPIVFSVREVPPVQNAARPAQACTPFASHISLPALTSGSLDLWHRKPLKSEHSWPPSSCMFLRARAFGIPDDSCLFQIAPFCTALFLVGLLLRRY